MLNLKDFKPGGKVFILTENFGRNKEPKISERTVKSVGRKYVTLNGGWEEKFSIPHMSVADISYLEEAKDWGERSLLFKSRQDADDYLERKQIEQWLFRLSPRETDNLSLKQLRKIRDIVKNPEAAE